MLGIRRSDGIFHFGGQILTSPTPLTLNMRKDVYLYNEATGWLLTSGSRNGLTSIPEGDDWNEAVRRGAFIPMSLMQDDALVLRVVANEPLLEQEEAEWLDRFVAKLSIPDGKLAMCGGIEFLESPETFQDYVRYVDVDPGDYLVTVYTYFGSVNAPDEDDVNGKGETLKKYWKRTRKGEKVPGWIIAADEGEEWEEDVPTYLIGNLIHLMPHDREPAPLTLEGGWISEEVAPRLPELCPRGILTTEVEGLTDRDEYVQTDLEYIHKIPDLVADLEVVPVAGGPISVGVAEVVLPYWLAWFCGETHPYLRLSNCPGVEIEWPGFLEGIKGTPTDDGWRVDIEGQNARFTQFRHLRRIGELLTALPDRAVIELAAAQDAVELDDDQEEEEKDSENFPPLAGFHRYSGPVRGGQWHIEATYPPIDSATLTDMLTLARETEAGQGITVRDDDEADQILEDCEERDMALMDTPPRKKGKQLTFKKADLHLLPFLGARFWWTRFREVWPTINRDDEDEVDDWDDMMDSVAEAGAKWTVGEPVVFESSFARYTRTDLIAAGITDAGEVTEIDAEFRAQGFELLGDLHSSQTFAAVFRGYGAPDSTIYGAIICNGQGSRGVDLVTRFEDGWSVTTSKMQFVAASRTDQKQKTFRQEIDGDLVAMRQAHDHKVAEYQAKHGAVLPAVATLEAFAEALDAALRKQFGA